MKNKAVLLFILFTSALNAHQPKNISLLLLHPFDSQELLVAPDTHTLDNQVCKFLGIRKEHVYQLGFPTIRLDTIPRADLVTSIAQVFKSFEPEELFLPHPGDIHSDHRITFEAASACTKWFRYPSLKRILTYETLSDTDFGLISSQVYRPNIFINIEPYFSDKLKLLDIYASELGKFPFPRRHEAITALAKFRGASSGFKESEAFELLRERVYR